MPKVVVVSGYFDPCHFGHIEHMRKASQLGDVLIVIINSDEQVMRKYGYILQPMYKRIERIMRKAPFAHGVVISIDKDSTQTETLRMIRPQVFAKGGDRVANNMPKSEVDVCRKIGCEIVYGVGEKLNSSTKIRKRIERLVNATPL